MIYLGRAIAEYSLSSAKSSCRGLSSRALGTARAQLPSTSIMATMSAIQRSEDHLIWKRVKKKGKSFRLLLHLNWILIPNVYWLLINKEIALIDSLMCEKTHFPKQKGFLSVFLHHATNMHGLFSSYVIRTPHAPTLIQKNLLTGAFLACWLRFGMCKTNEVAFLIQFRTYTETDSENRIGKTLLHIKGDVFAKSPH